MKIKISFTDDGGNIYEGVVQLKKIGKSKNQTIHTSRLKLGSRKKIEKDPKSIMDFLMFLKSKGFFKSPRSRKDIIEKLTSMDQHYNATSLDSPLNRAFKSKKLGRISKKGLYLYVSR